MRKLPADIFPGETENAVRSHIEKETSGCHLVTNDEIHALIRPRDPAGHKGTFGHALIIAGTEGKAGAAILTALAALRTGCGLLTAIIPESAQAPLLTLLPEAMTIVKKDDGELPDISRFNAIGFGPGVGLEPSAMPANLLSVGKPLVIDADGITLLSRQKELLGILSTHVILTPHPAEFDRLTSQHASSFERFKTQIGFSKKNSVYVLLKGRYTSITTPEGRVFFNTTGNNGMATAGSGDVLTGIITSLLAQQYAPETAAVLGAYIHGLAGDKAAASISRTCLVASDIVNGLKEVFLEFEK